MEKPEELLRAEKITKEYEGEPVIQEISLHLDRNELVSLLGPSGSGKTTLFHVLSGLNLPEAGRVLLRGEDITGRPGQVSYMLQKDLLLEHKKVIDNVALPLVLSGMKKKEARKIASPLFGEFGLEGSQLRYPAQLSGGMRQRAALLRTYLSSVRQETTAAGSLQGDAAAREARKAAGDMAPSGHPGQTGQTGHIGQTGRSFDGVALLDEPFSALDTITKDQIHTWYLEIMEKIHLSTLLITHDIDEAILLSDRIYIMTGVPGRIEAEFRIAPPRSERKDFALTPLFLEYKKKILRVLQTGSIRLSRCDAPQ